MNHTRRVRRAEQRHRGDVGAVLHAYGDIPGTGTRVGFVISWAVMSAITFINPGETAALAVAPTIAFALIGLVIWLLLSSERLLVCERGLVVGSVGVGLRPYVIRYEQIAPGTLVPLTGAHRYSKQTGTAGDVSRTKRAYWWTRSAIHFMGPLHFLSRSGQAAAAARPVGAYAAGSVGPWLVGTGRTPPQDVVAQIARAASTAGVGALAAAASEPVRELSGNPADVSRQLPGHRG